MKKIIMAAATVAALAAGSVFAGQCTGGDKDRSAGGRPLSTANRRSQPPDPLVAHKSPGRNKGSRPHHRKHRRVGQKAVTLAEVGHTRGGESRSRSGEAQQNGTGPMA
jgi:hypothetical protein